MKKSELIREIAKQTQIKEDDIQLVMDTLVAQITAKLKAKEEVKIHGFGKFKARKYGKRKCYNPQDGKLMTLPASVQPAFIPSGKFRELIK